MTHPFDLAASEIGERVDELVAVTFADLQSQFRVLPRGLGFVEFADFQEAHETLKAETGGFTEFTVERVWGAVTSDALAFVVIRTMLGFSLPEWAEVTESQTGTALPQDAARTLDRRVRRERGLFARSGFMETLTGQRARTLLEVAVLLLTKGLPRSARR